MAQRETTKPLMLLRAALMREVKKELFDELARQCNAGKFKEQECGISDDTMAEAVHLLGDVIDKVAANKEWLGSKPD